MPGKKRQFDVAHEPVFASPVMRALDNLLKQLAPKEVGITLVGESGTGKEVLAHRVHVLSGRRTGPFVPINCAAVPESLFESELFGHERGAFTGATERTSGKIEAANGGTLFLDEIGEMPFSVQAKLLRFLESRRFMRVGGVRKVEVDCRLVCATLRPLEEEVKRGRFRADLYYRIQNVTLDVPPLRERPADLRPLIEHFTKGFARKHGGAAIRFTRPALAAMRAYGWPGNVRELSNVVERLSLLRPGRSVRLVDLPLAIQRCTPSHAVEGPVGKTITISLDDSLDVSVQRILDAALMAENGNRSRAARRLGVSVRTMQRRARMVRAFAPEGGPATREQQG